MGEPDTLDYLCMEKGLFAYEDDCNKYISCSEDLQAHLATCPPTLIFNFGKQECDSPPWWSWTQSSSAWSRASSLTRTTAPSTTRATTIKMHLDSRVHPISYLT